jgi:hypothetical protein
VTPPNQTYPLLGDWHGLVWTDSGEHFRYEANADRVVVWKWDGKRYRRVPKVPVTVQGVVDARP